MTDPYANFPQPDQERTAPVSNPGTTAPMNGGQGVSPLTGEQPSSQFNYDQNYARTQAVYASASNSVPARRSGGLTFLWGFLGALAACVLAFIILWAMGGLQFGSSAGSEPHDTVTTSSLGADQYNPVVVDDNQTLAEAVSSKCLPSVAAIDVYGSANSAMNQYGYGYGYGYGNQDNSDSLTMTSMGSGVVLSADGYVITNYHVVESGSAFRVTVEGTEYDADMVGSDPSSDIAVLKLQNASGLTPIEVGDSDNLAIGEWVMTLGSPFGLEQSVATGIVSATSRSQIMDSTSTYGSSTGSPTLYPSLIQTDAAINPGNSGGALVDANGQLIGINTLITSYSGNYSGVGFAIPSNYAINLAQQIINGEEPTHAQLGVSLSTVNSSIASRYGLATDSGAYVSAVTPGSGAANAGIKEGDIITAFDGKEVSSSSDLMLDVRTKNPGDVVTITLNRNGQTSDVQVTLGSDADSSTGSQSNSQQEPQNNGNSFLDRLLGNNR